MTPLGAAASPEDRFAGAANPVAGAPSQRRPSATDAMTVEQINSLAQQHPRMKSVLERRLSQVRRLKELWATGNLSDLSSVVEGKQDHAVFCDFVRSVMQNRLEASLNLDACQFLLPIVRDMVSSKYECFQHAATDFAEVLYQRFGDLIADTRRSQAGVNERHPDIAREERLQKCNACHEHFQEIFRLLPADQLAGRFQ